MRMFKEKIKRSFFRIGYLVASELKSIVHKRRIGTKAVLVRKQDDGEFTRSDL